MSQTFTIDQKTLLTILASMQPICTKRTPLDATSSILFQVGYKELILKSTDLEISLQSSSRIYEGSIEEPFSFLVSGKRIFDVVKELDEKIVCTFNRTMLSLNAGAVDVALNIKDAQEFPPFPERIENLMHIQSQMLLQLLDKVAFVIPQNNANPSLNGLLLEISPHGITMTATDGHCLAQVKSAQHTLDKEYTWLLPRRAIMEIKKILEGTQEPYVFIGVCGNQLVFSGETFNFFTKVLTDQFPQYKSILQKEGFVPAAIDRTRFIKTLRRSTCLLSGQFLATQFTFDTHKVNVALQNKEVGNLHEELELKSFSGGRLDIRFYAPYLLSSLQALPDSEVTFYLNNSTKPIIFESHQDEYDMTCLIMPVSPTNS